MHTSDFQFAPQSESKHYYPDKVPLPDCRPNMAEFRPIEAQSYRTASHRNDHNLLLATATIPGRNELPICSSAKDGSILLSARMDRATIFFSR
jgi:hypothetical protein